MADEVSSAVIMDCGSGFTKAGLTGDDLPSSVFPTVIGRGKLEKEVNQDFYVGKEAFEKKGVLNMSKPIQRGFIKDWDNLEFVWQHCFNNELKIESSDHPLVYGMYPDEQKSYKERMAYLFFEGFGVAGLYCGIHGLLGMYATGKTGGLVIDSGEDVTTIIPIQDGNFLEHFHGMIEIGGHDINEYLQKLLKDKKINLDIEDVRKLKESKAYIATDYDKEHDSFKMGLHKNNLYELPDRTVIELSDEIIKAPEIVFKPGLVGKFELGVHEMVNECLQKVDVEVKRELYGNVILSGGNGLVQNYTNRLNKELITLSPNNIKLKITASNDRQYLSWLGGSIISSLATFQNMWVTPADYEENGPSVVHRKCL